MNQRIIGLIRLAEKAIEIIVLLDAFFLVNLYAILGNTQFPDVRLFSGHGWRYIPSMLFAAVLILVFIQVNKVKDEFVTSWRQSPALILFLVVATLSLIWSVYFQASVYKLLFLFFSTMVASYISIRFRLRGSIDIITWAAVISTILSVLILIFIPNGIMYNHPYVGSWRGMYWHRNHAGDIMAFFNAVFLFRILFLTPLKKFRKFIEALFYFVTFLLVFGSRSATGVVVLVVLHGTIGLWYAWLKWGSLLGKRHYYLIAGIFVTGAIVFFTNVSFFFGLLGRSANMTGRLPLWEDLLFNIWTQKPWLGYGYGALWMQHSFRYLMMERQGWTLFPVFFADNGFLDILLNVGVVGFIPFIIMFFSGWIRSLKYAISSRDSVVFFLVLIFTYVFIGNLSYSFLLEVDQFVWALLIISVFLVNNLRMSLPLN